MSAFVDRLKLPAVEKSSRLRAATSFVVVAPLGARSIVIPIKNGRGLNLVPNADLDLRNALAKCLAHRSGPVIDVGANVGVLLVALLSIDPSVPYVGFDPDIDCCEYLSSFIQENKLGLHMVFPVALSDRTCTIALKYNHAADVSATIVDGFRPKGMYANTRYVLAVPGDEILRPLFAARDEADYTRFYTGYNPLKELLTHIARQRHIGYISLRGENLNVEMTQ